MVKNFIGFTCRVSFYEQHNSTIAKELRIVTADKIKLLNLPSRSQEIMKVYVYEGYIQAGGTYMAYHLGRILHQYFGAEVFIVGNRPEQIMFSYPVDFPTIHQEVFEAEITSDDVLICNPSFSVQQFGLRLPCKKLCYIQGIRTFAVLDVFFDHYVFVSDWAKSYIERYYGISGNVIPAFINTDLFSCADDWPTRKTSIPITYYKYDDVVLSRLLKVFTLKYPDFPIEFEKYPVMGQQGFAKVLRKHRYYLSMAAMEGFGLPMLEAMAAGCVAVGWDAGGSSEYTVHGKNCMIARYGDIEALADHLHFVLTNPEESRNLAAAGYTTGKKFDITRFDEAWKKELSIFLRQ